MINDERDIKPASKPDVKVSGTKSKASAVQSKLSLGKWDDIRVYLIKDMLIPGVKKAILGAIQLFLFPDYRGGVGGTMKSDGLYGKASYSSIWGNNNATTKASRPSSPVSDFDYSNLTFRDKSSAYELLDELDEIIDRYGHVSVAQMYELKKLSAPYTAENYGWKSTKGAEVVRIDDPEYPYMLRMPKFQPIRK